MVWVQFPAEPLFLFFSFFLGKHVQEYYLRGLKRITRESISWATAAFVKFTNTGA